jgi:hypothetical protein
MELGQCFRVIPERVQEVSAAGGHSILMLGRIAPDKNPVISKGFDRNMAANISGGSGSPAEQGPSYQDLTDGNCSICRWPECYL